MDITIKNLNDFKDRFNMVGKALGISSWGMNMHRIAAGATDYPEHKHDADGQEEVYLIFEGSATLHTGKEKLELKQGSIARIAPTQNRKFVPGPKGVTILAMGGTPGKAFKSEM